MITKESILNNLQTGSDSIAKEFDTLHAEEVTKIVGELATSYQTLQTLLNKGDEDPTRLSDVDFQSALIYWSSLNTIFSGVDLLRRGYLKEPQMLMRNALESFSAAYDIHVHPEKLDQLLQGSKKFDSTDSIAEAKKIFPIIGMWYGMLSNEFTHVGRLHSLPHKVTNSLLSMGGHFDSNDQSLAKINLLAILGTINVLGDLLELTFIRHIPEPRFWEKVDGTTYNHKPNREIIEKILADMKPLIETLGD